MQKSSQLIADVSGAGTCLVAGPIEGRVAIARRAAGWVALGLTAAMFVAGCAQRRAPAPQGAEPSAPPVLAAPPAAGAASSAISVADYKREVARRIHQVSSAQVFEGAPPNLLRSVIVMSVVLDGSGNVVNARVLRDNGDSETVQSALDSVRRSSPYPRPTSRLLDRDRLEFTESWLFRNDGKFQLRTLADAWQQ